MGFIKKKQSPGADAVREVKQFFAKHSRHSDQYRSPKVTLALDISSAEDSQALNLMRTKFHAYG